MSGFDVLLRLAFGGDVSQHDALAALHSDVCERQDAPRLDRCARIKARNEALLDAAELMGSDRPGAWVLAERLECAIERFQTRIWPRLIAGERCPLAPSDEALYRAFLAGIHVPKTQRRLYDLLSH